MTADASIALRGLHHDAQDIFHHSLEACSIEAAFDRHLHFEGNSLVRRALSGAPQRIDLDKYKSILLLAIGKAATSMMETLLLRMSRRKGVRGLCCAPTIPLKRNWRIRYFVGGHPLPDQESLRAARFALRMLARAGKDTFIIFLISGGGSAMFELPLDAAISLEETRSFHQALISSGATIAEMNTVRKHFSAVKGGRLAMAAPAATRLSLLLPDVPLRHLDALASSPTLPDPTTVQETHEILARYHLLEKFPEKVRLFFEREDLPETPGVKAPHATTNPAGGAQTRVVPGAGNVDPSGSGNIGFEILLSSDDMAKAATAYARSLGYEVVLDNTSDDWDYRDAARYLLERFHSLRRGYPRLCLISCGEVTVKLDAAAGTGGRNQQFALACALDLAKWEGDPLAVFSAGSDGIDGNSTAAGATADTTTVRRARACGFDPEASLAKFNACPLFTALGDALVIGPTGHNLRDLRMLLADRAGTIDETRKRDPAAR